MIVGCYQSYQGAIISYRIAICANSTSYLEKAIIIDSYADSRDATLSLSYLVAIHGAIHTGCPYLFDCSAVPVRALQWCVFHIETETQRTFPALRYTTTEQVNL